MQMQDLVVRQLFSFEHNSKSTQSLQLWELYQKFWFKLFDVYLVCLHILFVAFKGVLVLAQKFWDWKLGFIRKPNAEKKRLVIVGGGYAGTYAATHLEHKFFTTLVDTKHYFEFTPSKLRSLVEPEKCQQVQMNFYTILQQTKLVCSKVQEVSTDNVTTEDGEVLPYDYLLICTGSRYHEADFPPFRHNRIPRGNPRTVFASVRSNSFAQYHDLLMQSQRIVVIGGGTVGVELAAEIIEHCPNKEVTLVHSKEHLMQRSTGRAIRYAESYFVKNGVRLLLGQKVVAHEGCFFATDNGQIIEADLAFICTGNVANTDFMKQSCFADKLSASGLLQVNDFLQLNGYRNIFVAGDITDIPQEEEKLCQTAGAEVAVVIKNLESMLTNAPLHRYIPSPCPMLISLGKVDGIFTYRGFSFTGFLPAIMKEFVEWKEMIWYWDWYRFFPHKLKYTCPAAAV
jgi:NADH dehydrogenase FAD-containing subunit